MQTVEDAVSAPGRDSGTNPTPARITTTYTYDDVGNMTSMTDGRGIVTQYVYNQLNQLVETINAAQVPGDSASEPLPLTAFGYIERYFYDANGNVVLHQVEDRGDTSNVGFAPPAGSLPSYITNTEPAGGPTYRRHRDPVRHPRRSDRHDHRGRRRPVPRHPHTATTPTEPGPDDPARGERHGDRSTTSATRSSGPSAA